MFRPFGAFVSPWCRYRSSEDYLTERKDSISLRDRLKLLLGTARGVQYLHTHEPPLIHGDIKPSNILIADGGVPKICDFGFARVLLENESSFFTITSSDWTGERYLAPELIGGDDTTVQTVETDVYAVGCVGLRFIFDKVPYGNLRSNSRGQIFMVLLGGRPPATFIDSMDTPKDEIARIIQLTWAHAPWDRPTIQDFVLRLDGVVVQHEEE
ncbi:kinase-like protein [Serendipita vermifera]|nr:kinase-like protein [Serendipita vermifera]